MDLFRNQIAEHLTREHALTIRHWRVDLDASWRRVASLAYERWGRGWCVDAHPIFGKALCVMSAEMLGQDPHADPWN